MLTNKEPQIMTIDFADIKPGALNLALFGAYMLLVKFILKLAFSASGGRWYVRGLTELVDL